MKELLLVLPLLGITVLWIWALIDCATKEPDGNQKIVWIIVICLTQFIGALVYLIARRPARIRESGH